MSGKITEETEGFFCLRHRIRDKAADHRPDRMKLIFERSDDAKIAAAAAQTPKQVGMLGLADCQEIAVRGDQIGRDQIVRDQTIAAREMAPPAAEGKPGNAVVDICPPGAARPKVWVSRSNSPQVAPASARAVR